MSSAKPVAFSLAHGAGTEFLKAVVVASENPGCVVAPEAASLHAAACVAAALADRELFSVLGGREGVPWALGSAHAGRVILCLGMGVQTTRPRVINLQDIGGMVCTGFTVTNDGSAALVVTDNGNIHAFRVADGRHLKTVGCSGFGPLRFNRALQISVSPDDFVFVVDSFNHRVQVLTPQLQFHSFAGVGILNYPRGVCANHDVIAVAQRQAICILSRSNGTLLRSLTRLFSAPTNVCLAYSRDAIAVAMANNVSIISLDGRFIHGFPSASFLDGIACSRFGDLVATMNCEKVGFYLADGSLVREFRAGSHSWFIGAAIANDTVFVMDICGRRCFVFK